MNNIISGIDNYMMFGGHVNEGEFIDIEGIVYEAMKAIDSNYVGGYVTRLFELKQVNGCKQIVGRDYLAQILPFEYSVMFGGKSGVKELVQLINGEEPKCSVNDNGFPLFKIGQYELIVGSDWVSVNGYKIKNGHDSLKGLRGLPAESFSSIIHNLLVSWESLGQKQRMEEMKDDVNRVVEHLKKGLEECLDKYKDDKDLIRSQILKDVSELLA